MWVKSVKINEGSLPENIHITQLKKKNWISQIHIIFTLTKPIPCTSVHAMFSSCKMNYHLPNI